MKPHKRWHVIFAISVLFSVSIFVWNCSYVNLNGIILNTRKQALRDNFLSFAEIPEVINLAKNSNSRANICLNRGKWVSKKYIYPNKTEDCRLLVKSILSYKSPQRVTLLGDSTMRFTLYGALNNYNKTECVLLKKANNTNGNMKYMNLAPRKTLSFKDSKAYAKLRKYETPGFSGCKGCTHRLFKCLDAELEYLGVEFAHDNYLLSPRTNSTQETVALYLKSDPPDLCLVSSGQHDFRLKHLSEDQFINNVNAYINAIKTACKNTIWISMNKVKGDKRFPQNNKDILIRNARVANIIATHHPSVGYIDMYSMSQPYSLHLDNIHLNSTYYQTVASYFVDQTRDVGQHRAWALEGMAFTNNTIHI